MVWNQGLIGCFARVIAKILWLDLGKIPSEELLWRSVNENKISGGQIQNSIFIDKGGLSCDLARFSTITKSRLGYIDPKWDSRSGLLEFKASDVTDVNPSTSVVHKPLKGSKQNNRVMLPNYSHCQFEGNHLSRGQSKALLEKAKRKVTHGFEEQK